MRAKVTVSISQDLLAQLDAEAEALGRSRSELVQEAAASYLGQSRDERVTQARRARILAAVDDMRGMAQRHPLLDGRSSLETLRDVRATDDAGQLRGVEDSPR